MREKAIEYSDAYWEKEVERGTALIKAQEKPADADVIFFWGMCVVVALSIVLGPTALSILGII